MLRSIAPSGRSGGKIKPGLNISAEDTYPRKSKVSVFVPARVALARASRPNATSRVFSGWRVSPYLANLLGSTCRTFSASSRYCAYFAQGRPAVHGMSVHGFTPGWSSAREAGRSRLSLSDVCGSSSRRLSSGPRAGSLKRVRAGRWVTGWDETERSALGFSDLVTT